MCYVSLDEIFSNLCVAFVNYLFLQFFTIFIFTIACAFMRIRHNIIKASERVRRAGERMKN